VEDSRVRLHVMRWVVVLRVIWQYVPAVRTRPVLEEHEIHLDDCELEYAFRCIRNLPCSPSCGDMPPVGAQNLDNRFLESVCYSLSVQ
jgi:hypothetical protein